jgi:hypothetical protein
MHLSIIQQLLQQQQQQQHPGHAATGNTRMSNACAHLHSLRLRLPAAPARALLCTPTTTGCVI